jgi:hypothetical protein
MPCLAFCAVDCLGIIKDPGDRARDEWLKWKPERRQREG